MWRVRRRPIAKIFLFFAPLLVPGSNEGTLD
jgi:hypothetical protein